MNLRQEKAKYFLLSRYYFFKRRILSFTRKGWLHHRRICDRPTPVSFDLLFLIFQALNIIVIRAVQLTDCLIVISWRRLWEDCFTIFFSLTKSWWYGPDRGLLAQAVREAEMLRATLTVTANLHRSCRLHLSNTYNSWWSQWRSWLAKTKS